MATLNTDIISAVCVAFFWVVNESRNEKSCLQFLITIAVFYKLLNPGQSRARFEDPSAILKKGTWPRLGGKFEW